MSIKEYEALKEEIRLVKANLKEIAKRAERLEPEPVLDGMEREWAESNFEEILIIHNMAYSAAISTEWIIKKLDEIGREKRWY